MKKFNSVLAIVVAITILITLLLILLIRNNKLKTAYRSELLQHQLFSTHLNPQVVYRGLNDMMDYVKRSDFDPAAKYLSHFSRYLQTTLCGSQKEFIPLEKELLQISNYLEIQQLCHPGCFYFTVIPPGKNFPEDLAITPFLIQPFLEKAVSAIIENKPEHGRITIGFQIQGTILIATLDDNGIATAEKQVYKATCEELNMKTLTLTAERPAILWRKGRKTKYIHVSVIQDPDSGEPFNRVRLDLPVNRI